METEYINGSNFDQEFMTAEKRLRGMNVGDRDVTEKWLPEPLPCSLISISEEISYPQGRKLIILFCRQRN